MGQQWQRWTMAAATAAALVGGLGITLAHAQGGMLPPTIQQGD